MDEEYEAELTKEAHMLLEWQKDVFLYIKETLGLLPSEPIDSLRGKKISYTDAYGNERTTMLFNDDGDLTYHDLSFYTVDMFKNQGRVAFRAYRGRRLTWQQTLTFTAYQRALDTFDKDSFDLIARFISVISGHGTGKTASLAIIAQHFLFCFPGAQIGVTANTETQLKDIFLKEFYVWCEKLPKQMRDQIDQQDEKIKIKDEKDWFLRARVSRQEKPEALAGIHGPYVLIIVDEASGVPNPIFEVMKGALTGDNFIVMYCSNGTRTEGEFYDSQKNGSMFVKLAFSSRQSPIVKEGYIAKMESDYPPNGSEPSDEVIIRVDGKFAHIGQMDNKGWIPLFANIQIFFEPEHNQIIRNPVIAADVAGQGKDRSSVGVRDAIYLKEVLNERKSTEKDLARKIETIRDSYGAPSNDIGIDAFGIGAKVVANIQVKTGETVNALLTDKPREETKHLYHTFKAELAWKFRTWLANGGIIITNRKQDWMRELEKIKYKRDLQGRIMLMDKVAFKKEYKFSPDKFDMAIYTFFKDFGTAPVVLTKKDLESKDMMEWIKRQQKTKSSNKSGSGYSSMWS